MRLPPFIVAAEGEGAGAACATLTPATSLGVATELAHALAAGPFRPTVRVFAVDSGRRLVLVLTTRGGEACALCSGTKREKS